MVFQDKEIWVCVSVCCVLLVRHEADEAFGCLCVDVS